MIEWLKDALGINRYVVAWNFTFPGGHKHEGRDFIADDKRCAAHIARGMNRKYGAGTHWIERA